MSHNVLNLNNNSFDVNSNLTQSITDAEYYYVQAVYGVTYPITPVVGDDLLINKHTELENPSSPSWLTINNHATHTTYLESITLTQDGTYLINARAALNRINNFSGGVGFYLYNKTTSTVISNSVYYNYNELAYLWNKNIHTIIERSGSDIEVSIRIFYLSGVDTDFRSYWQTRLLVEKLQ